MCGGGHGNGVEGSLRHGWLRASWWTLGGHQHHGGVGRGRVVRRHHAGLHVGLNNGERHKRRVDQCQNHKLSRISVTCGTTITALPLNLPTCYRTMNQVFMPSNQKLSLLGDKMGCRLGESGRCDMCSQLFLVKVFLVKGNFKIQQQMFHFLISPHCLAVTLLSFISPKLAVMNLI